MIEQFIIEPGTTGEQTFLLPVKVVVADGKFVSAEIEPERRHLWADRAGHLNWRLIETQ